MFRKIYKDGGSEIHLRIEDRGDKWAYIAETCPFCAGKESDQHICWLWIGTLKELLGLTGKEFDVEEAECRGMECTDLCLRGQQVGKRLTSNIIHQKGQMSTATRKSEGLSDVGYGQDIKAIQPEVGKSNLTSILGGIGVPLPDAQIGSLNTRLNLQ